jgi:acetoin utilization protein AcuB
MKAVPTIQRYMTPHPHTIAAGRTLRAAHNLMREEVVVGIVSDRDLAIIMSLKDVNPDVISVEEAMTPDVVSVAPDTPLDEVAVVMAERKVGSVVVAQNHKVVGIFTTVDAMGALVDLLRTRLK